MTGGYTTALLIGRALHLASTRTPTAKAVRELTEVADGRLAPLLVARRHYDALSDDPDLEAARARHLLRLAVWAVTSARMASGREVVNGGAAAW